MHASCMPPRFFVESPRCARCNERVYAAEKVLGPLSKPYHKHCLKCVVCNKLLDSVSLLEHDGEPYCNNCHRIHLGQGKDRFGTAVPLRPQVKTAPKESPEPKSALSAHTSPQSSLRTSPSPGRRPLPTTPTGSTQPLPLSSSLSRQSLAEKSVDATKDHLSKDTEEMPAKLASPSAPVISGTPLCARCHKPVCTYLPTLC